MPTTQTGLTLGVSSRIWRCIGGSGSQVNLQFSYDLME